MSDPGAALRVDTHSLISAEVGLRWKSEIASHDEVFHFPALNVWRDLDLLPRPLQQGILGQVTGHRASQSPAVR